MLVLNGSRQSDLLSNFWCDLCSVSDHLGRDSASPERRQHSRSVDIRTPAQQPVRHRRSASWLRGGRVAMDLGDRQRLPTADGPAVSCQCLDLIAKDLWKLALVLFVPTESSVSSYTHWKRRFVSFEWNQKSCISSAVGMVSRLGCSFEERPPGEKSTRKNLGLWCLKVVLILSQNTTES